MGHLYHLVLPCRQQPQPLSLMHLDLTLMTTMLNRRVGQYSSIPLSYKSATNKGTNPIQIQVGTSTQHQSIINL